MAEPRISEEQLIEFRDKLWYRSPATQRSDFEDAIHDLLDCRAERDQLLKERDEARAWANRLTGLVAELRLMNAVRPTAPAIPPDPIDVDMTK